MLTVSNLSLQFGKRVLFDEVNIMFTKGNCYGIIGANGAGKSTFLKILTGDQDPTTGNVSLEPGKRMSVLEQNHFAYDNFTVLETVLRGNEKLFKIKEEMDALYAKEDFSDADGIKAGELGVTYDEMGGWNSESDAMTMLSNVGVKDEMHYQIMGELENQNKVKVLLAQALFGNPDVLILDEPTNDLDIETIAWLEDFLSTYENTVIVVSHDRHFLDTVCTNIADLDYSKLNLYTGNYSFWYQASQLATRQRQQANKKAEDKKKELQDFIARFSSNVAKAKQATARKKMIDKLNIDDIKPSSRRYPAIIFDTEREAGDQILEIKNLEKTKDGELLFSKIDLNLKKGDKVAVLSKNSLAITEFFEVLAGNVTADKGEFNWGITTNQSYMPLDNNSFFEEDINLVDWLRQFTKNDDERHEEYMRGFLGKMLFSGDEALKSCKVLSGGEKMRCMFSRMMLQRANVLLMDEPTNHLDLPSIEWLEKYLLHYKGSVVIVSHDKYFLNRMVNKIVEVYQQELHIYSGNYDYYATEKELRVEMQQRAFENQQDYIRQQERFIERFKAKASKAAAAQSAMKRLDKIDRIEQVEIECPNLRISFKVDKQPGKIIATIKDATKKFGSNTILENAEAEINRGDKIALIGANGKGKSTLLRMIVGSEPFEGERIWGHNVDESFYAQHQLEALNINNTILDEMKECGSGKTEMELRSLMGCFLFSGDDVDKKIRILSGGEKARVALAKVITGKGNFLMLDEPTNTLVMHSVGLLAEALNKYEGPSV